MDSLKCQTATVARAEPGGFLALLTPATSPTLPPCASSCLKSVSLCTAAQDGLQIALTIFAQLLGNHFPFEVP